MNHMKFTLVLLGLCCVSLAARAKVPPRDRAEEAEAARAQKNAAQAAPHSPFSTSTCSFTFTSGANDTFLKYCVTANGNITQLETPLGQEHIAVGDFGEGYGFCDVHSGTAYGDYADAGDSGNWGTATVLTHNATTVKIVRSTSDGIWTLTQTITQVASTSSVKIGMTLKNNTTVDRPVTLLRYADVDAAGFLLNNLDGTVNSAFAWNSLGNDGPFGLMLQNVGTSPFDRFGYAQNFSGGANPCHISEAQGPLTETDGSIVYMYFIDIPGRASKTVTVSYRGF
jgi:hypothetical protein